MRLKRFWEAKGSSLHEEMLFYDVTFFYWAYIYRMKSPKGVMRQYLLLKWMTCFTHAALQLLELLCWVRLRQLRGSIV